MSSRTSALIGFRVGKIETDTFSRVGKADLSARLREQVSDDIHPHSPTL